MRGEPSLTVDLSMSMLFGGSSYHQCIIYTYLLTVALNGMHCTLLLSLIACTHMYCIHNIIAPSGSPEWLTVRCGHPTSVQLSWGTVPKDQQNGEITGYSMQVKGPDTTRNMPPIYRSHSLMEDAYTSTEVCDLKPCTEYTFNVSAKTAAGSGPAISVSFVTPQEGEASMLPQC